MRHMTTPEIQKAALLKAARAAIRLKHALAADEEIAKMLPDLEKRIDTALASGHVFELKPGQVFDAS